MCIGPIFLAGLVLTDETDKSDQALFGGLVTGHRI